MPTSRTQELKSLPPPGASLLLHHQEEEHVGDKEEPDQTKEVIPGGHVYFLEAEQPRPQLVQSLRSSRHDGQ